MKALYMATLLFLTGFDFYLFFRYVDKYHQIYGPKHKWLVLLPGSGFYIRWKLRKE